MDAAGYTALGRQSGLMREMQLVANNIANLSTTGFRREGMVFAEHVKALDEEPSLSMAHGTGRIVDLSQAGLTMTGANFDFAIQGDGFFLIETPEGNRLTRSGSFTPNAAGELVTPWTASACWMRAAPRSSSRPTRARRPGRGWHAVGRRPADRADRAVAADRPAGAEAPGRHPVRRRRGRAG
jgi:hypothetical protein